MKVARIYLRVSTDEQDLARQENVINSAKANGFYFAGVYREKASGARADLKAGKTTRYRHLTVLQYAVVLNCVHETSSDDIF